MAKLSIWYSILCMLFLAMNVSTLYAQEDEDDDEDEEIEVKGEFDQKQFDIIRKGKKAWEMYRKDFPDVKINLSGADLSDLILSGADLRGADLSNTDLRGTDLRNAVLEGADLSNADLGEHEGKIAKLSGANFNKAKLIKCDMTSLFSDMTTFVGADLSGTDLSGSNFKKANMTDAILDGCDVESCTFERTILIGAKLDDLSNKQAAIMKDCIYKKEDMYLYTSPETEKSDKK